MPPDVDGSGCRIASDIAAPEDRTTSDAPQPEKGDYGKTSTPGALGNISPYEALSSEDAIAIGRVVGRDWPQLEDVEASGALQPGTPDPTPVDSQSNPATNVPKGTVVRPLRIVTERIVSGSVPKCLQLNVPGGRVGQRYDRLDANFPSVIRVGDRFWIDFVRLPPKNGDPRELAATDLLTVRDNGSVTLPNGYTVTDVWSFNVDDAKNAPDCVTRRATSDTPSVSAEFTECP
jgi:hypothetical protein